MSNKMFSILTPVFRPKKDHFDECVASVLSQTHGDFEWLIVDDASGDSWLNGRLKEITAADARCKSITLARNLGIAGASQLALNQASGDFIILLDQDDVLTHCALERVAAVIGRLPSVDYIYSDEDKVDEEGIFRDPFFKPDWSPELFRQVMYTGHVSALRTDVVLAVGGFDESMSGSQDYDLVFRVTEQARLVAHIPEVLYHWRVHENSTAASLDAKPYALRAAKKAVHQHCARVGIDAEVLEHSTVRGYWKLKRKLLEEPLVSILIPTIAKQAVIRGEDRILIDNLLSSLNSLNYSNYEVVISLDSSIPEEVLAPIVQHFTKPVRIVRYKASPEGFNFSASVNNAARHSLGKYLLFANDDLELIEPDSLSDMVALAMEDGVGAVGAKLLFEDCTVQHAGVGFGLGAPGPHHLYYGQKADGQVNFQALHLTREVSCVTGACLLMSRSNFLACGGLTEDLPNNFNDVDLCLKLVSKGLRILWSPYSVWFHYESKSRDNTVSHWEIERLFDRWGSLVWRDPFVNPNWADPQCEPRKDWDRVTAGWLERAVSESTIDKLGYLEANPDLLLAAAQDPNFDSYWHFQAMGHGEGRLFRRLTAREPRDQNQWPIQLATRASFSLTGYLLANPDLRAAANNSPHWDPFEHFLSHGEAEGRKQFLIDSREGVDREILPDGP